jgi:coproporphyrinogen III oxidase-like Fe-S oxidoreductase
MEGIDLAVVERRFGVATAEDLQKRAQPHIGRGAIIQTENLVLTNEGKLLADRIAADLFGEAGPQPHGAGPGS